jgi:hypothetical protein
MSLAWVQVGASFRNLTVRPSRRPEPQKETLHLVHALSNWFPVAVLSRGAGSLIVVLSKSSVRSAWVREELDAAFALTIGKRGVFILPVRVDSCRVPPFLKGKLYPDFRHSYESGLETLIKRFSG